MVEKAEGINVAKYDKIIVWSDGCSAQFSSRSVFRLLTEDLFDGVELTWNYNEKSHGKGPMEGVGGTVKNIIFRKVKSGFVTIIIIIIIIIIVITFILYKEIGFSKPYLQY